MKYYRWFLVIALECTAFFLKSFFLFFFSILKTYFGHKWLLGGSWILSDLVSTMLSAGFGVFPICPFHYRDTFPSGSCCFRFRKSLTPFKEKKNYLGGYSQKVFVKNRPISWKASSSSWGLFGRWRQDGTLFLRTRHTSWRMRALSFSQSEPISHLPIPTSSSLLSISIESWPVREVPFNSSSSLVNYCNWHNTVPIPKSINQQMFKS